MNTTKRIRELIRYGTSAQVAQAIQQCQAAFTRTCRWITTNRERNNRNLAFFNLLSQAIPFLEFAAWGIDKPIQVLAFSARSLFELNLRARHILLSDDNLRQWMAEAVIDSIQVVEGILELREGRSPTDVSRLQGEIERLRSLATKHDLASRGKPLGVGELANVVGQKTDYRTFFKLYSKLVHPSAYLVNGVAAQWDEVLRHALTVNLQLYAFDLLERVRTYLHVPDKIVYPQVKGSSA